MNNGIKSCVIEEGNLRAVKCTGDFGGPNMWDLYIKTIDGYWESVQWVNSYKAQQFFKTKLPVYQEPSKQQAQYQLA